ncbi:MAG: hypothetical protein WCT48_01440 [Candidatus Paceibacterota bacterium]
MENEKEVRVIGNASDEQKEQARKRVEKTLSDPESAFSEAAKEKLARLEYPKSKEEIEIIRFINERLKSLMKECGAEPYDISAENFHILPPDLYHEMNNNEDNHASAVIYQQKVLIDADSVRGNLLFFASLAAHESAHLRGHLALEVNESPQSGHFDETRYRRGWTVGSSRKKKEEGEGHSHFMGVHEAIATMVQKNMIGEILELPLFADEKELRESETWGKVKALVSEIKKIPEDDIIWVNPKNLEEGESYGYPAQRKTLEYVFFEVQKQFPEQYKTADDVYQEFLKAQFTGQMLSVARMIEKTFGEGSFRTLGNMDKGENSGIITLEALKKARMRTLRDAEQQ